MRLLKCKEMIFDIKVDDLMKEISVNLIKIHKKWRFTHNLIKNLHEKITTKNENIHSVVAVIYDLIDYFLIVLHSF